MDTATSNRISAAIERLEAAVTRNSRVGAGTNHSVTTSLEGLRCTTQEGEWTIDSDLGSGLGGDGTAPTPGVLVRAALGACMAMTYRLRAARHGVELRSVRVTVETDSAIAGMLLSGAAAPAGYSEVRYHVEVVSPAPRDAVLSILDEGDRLSPLLDVFSRSQALQRTVTIEAA